ncbi:MAG: hypothetical protein OXR03_24470 [Rhodospirillaceae bacterium]|nr:hypothetical protein [Rhodospirillaceae bacterium]MDD9928994.1 hypothetical protein [Rhodospirillaceae bacterium]
MSVTTVGQPPASLPVVAAPKPEPVNADGSAIPDEILYHHRPEDIGDLSNQDVPDESENNSEFFGKDGLTFGDVLDIINPLQHIPVVSTVYRAISGDEISPGARVAGGALFGGPIGFAVATANAMVEAATGEDIGENVMTAMFGDSDGPVPEEKDQIAAAAPASAAKATTVAAADPATVGIPSPPVSLLPIRSLPVAANAVLPAAAAPVLQQPAKLPFGGIGTLPNVPNQARPQDPVDALLQARAAVPLAGPIAGLGNKVRAQPATPQAPIPTISPLLADKLSALAAQTSAPKPADGEKAKPEPAATVPTAFMPQRMLDTLDRYERLKANNAS